MRAKSFFMGLLILCAMIIACNEGGNIKDEDKIWVVGQPTVELDRSVTIKIFFAKKPDPGSIKVTGGSGETDDELNGDEIEKSMQFDGTNYYYDMVFEAGKLGKSTFPVIAASIDGVAYKSAPFSIEVIKKQQVDSSAVKLMLVADKNRYELKDTIKIALLQYIKFSEYAKFTPADLVKNGAPEALFAVIDQGNVDYKVGIVGFKAYIDANFDVANFDWNVNEIGKHMIKLNHQDFIEHRIFEMKMTAKKKGKFTIPPSRFDYKIYPYKEAFQDELLAKDGTLESKNKMMFRSNALNIVVD